MIDKEGTWYSGSGILYIFTFQLEHSATCLRPFSTSVASRNCIRKRAASLRDWISSHAGTLYIALSVLSLLGAVSNLVVHCTTPIASLCTVFARTILQTSALIAGFHLLPQHNLFSFSPVPLKVEVPEFLIPLSTGSSWTKFSFG